MMHLRIIVAALLLPPLLAGCGAIFSRDTATENRPQTRAPDAAPAKPDSSFESDGKFYLDDGPPDTIPDGLENIPDAVPKAEKIIKATTRPYTALGKRWTPYAEVRPYRKRGIASWYGKRYHGRPTASGEIYDMFKMTAAHPLLAIPSYARVTRADTGKSVVVRINDRGPFLHGRVIDLSYAAAHRLGIVKRGAAEVIVEAIVPGAHFSDSELNSETDSDPAPSSENTPPQKVYIQLGAFSLRQNAEQVRREMHNKGLAHLQNKIHFRDDLFLMLVGPYPDEESARADDGVLCAAGWCGFFTRAP